MQSPLNEEGVVECSPEVGERPNWSQTNEITRAQQAMGCMWHWTTEQSYSSVSGACAHGYIDKNHKSLFKQNKPYLVYLAATCRGEYIDSPP